MKEQIIDLLDRYWHYELLLDETTDRLMELIAEAEKKAGIAAWMEARHRYSGVVGGEKPAEMAFEKWYEQFKQE